MKRTALFTGMGALAALTGYLSGYAWQGAS